MKPLSRYLTLFALGILAGGFSESTTLLLIPVWLVFMGISRRSLIFVAGLVVAFAVVYVAPGNAVRAAYFPERDLNAAWYAAWDWYLSTAQHFPAGLTGYALAFVGGYVYPLRDARRRVVWLILLATLTTFAAMMLVTYAAGYSYRPDRTLSLPIALWVIAWYALGSAVAGKRKTARGHWLLVAMVVVNALVPLALVVPMREYAIAWDMRRALIDRGVTRVPAITSDRDTLSEDPLNYGNVCAAAWHHVRELEVVNAG